MKGKFIVFDGCDGAGKSTLMQAVVRELQARLQTDMDGPFYRVTGMVETREPGGTPLGEAIRKLILRPPDATAPDGLTELFLFQAARRHHCRTIQAHLGRGTWVICDRFTASTRAYQGAGRGLDPMTIDFTTDLATSVGDDVVRPDLTVLVDIAPEAAAERRERRDVVQGSDRIDAETQEFHARVRLDFLRQASLNPTRWLVTDTTKWPLEDVVKYVVERIEALP